MESKRVTWAGLIAGVATISYYLLFYAIQPRLIFQLGVFWFSMIFPLAAMAFVAWKQRSTSEGALSLNTLLRSVFKVYVLSALFYHIFYFILFNFVDTSLAQIQQDVLLENLENSRKLFGERNADALQRDMESGLPTLSVGTALFAFARSLIAGFILSLLFAFAFRKE